MIKKIIVSLILLSGECQAGIVALTAASRANCGNNESVMWHLGHNHVMQVDHQHFKCLNRRCEQEGDFITHKITTEFINSWRVAAVHWAEAVPGSGWVSMGFYEIYERGKVIRFKSDRAVDCKLYDGWWDH